MFSNVFNESVMVRFGVFVLMFFFLICLLAFAQVGDFLAKKGLRNGIVFV